MQNVLQNLIIKHKRYNKKAAKPSVMGHCDWLIDWRSSHRQMETLVLFFAVCGPKYACWCHNFKRRWSFQRRFLINDILLQSEDIRDKVANRYRAKSELFSSKISTERSQI